MKLHGLTPVVSQGLHPKKPWTIMVFLYCKLRLSAIFLLLHLDIFTNDCFIDTDGWDEISDWPNTLFVSIELFQEWEFLLDARASVSFQNVHRGADAHARRNHYQHVNVIGLDISFDINYVRIMFSDLIQFMGHVLSHRRYQKFAAEPRYPDDMILIVVDDVSLAEIFHAYIIARNWR